MVRCRFCGVAWVDNTIFCSECGHYLLPNDENKATDPLDTEEAGELSHEDQVNAAGAPRHAEPIAIRLKIGERERGVEVPLTKAICLGRIDPSSDVFPDVDLSEHTPARNVSRRHASIRKREGRVVVEDIGSVNGTYVNGKRLNAFLPEMLQNGDVLHLGKLRIEVEILTD